MRTTKLVERKDWEGRRWVTLELEVVAGEESGRLVSGEAYDEEGGLVESIDVKSLPAGSRMVDLTDMECCEVAEDFEGAHTDLYAGAW